MKREALKETLELVSLGLSDQNIIPIFQCFCFEQGWVTSYDDSIGITADVKVNEDFAIHGKTTLGLISNSKAEDLEIKLEDNSVIIRADRSTFKLPYFPKSDFIFKAPEDKALAEISIDNSLLEGLEACLTTVSKDESQQALMGVFLQPGWLYSCDGDAVTRVKLQSGLSGSYSCMLPNRFCSSLLRITNTTKCRDGFLTFNNEWAVSGLNNAYIIYGRLLQNDNPIDLQELIDKTTKNSHLTFIAVPQELKGALARAQVIENIETVPTKFTIESGRLKLITDARAGTVRDSLSIAKHPDVEASLSAGLVQRTITLCDEISLNDNCLIGRHGDEIFQVVSTMDTK